MSVGWRQLEIDTLLIQDARLIKLKGEVVIRECSLAAIRNGSIGKVVSLINLGK